jgi:hypothetical protein
VHCEWHYVRQYVNVRAHFEFSKRLNALIGRVEAWSYAEWDAGARLPVEVAKELKTLSVRAPSPALKLGLQRAQDALDDGLSAEAVAAALYGVRSELDAGGGPLPPPSPSG